jgi:hypothetical protein
MEENSPDRYQMKAVQMSPVPPQDEVIFEVRFYLDDGVHGGKWIWPIKQQAKGHWEGEWGRGKGSGLQQPRLEDAY